MVDDARDVVRARVYQDTDRQAVERFSCAQLGNKAAEAAERVIRSAPEHLAEFGVWCWIVVAFDDSGIVGVIVFGLESEDDPAVTIFSLGVQLARQHQGIGTYLKRLILGVVAGMEGWPNSVISQVHRTNYRMIGLNKKLGVVSERDPEDGEFLITAILVEE